MNGDISDCNRMLESRCGPFPHNVQRRVVATEYREAQFLDEGGVPAAPIYGFNSVNELERETDRFVRVGLVDAENTVSGIIAGGTNLSAQFSIQKFGRRNRSWLAGSRRTTGLQSLSYPRRSAEVVSPHWPPACVLLASHSTVFGSQ
jgi:hypothetical protein